MKNKCNTLKNMLDYDNSKIKTHLDNCASCKLDYDNYKSTIDLFGKNVDFKNKDIVYQKVIDYVSKMPIIIQKDKDFTFIEYFIIAIRQLLKPVYMFSFILFIIFGTYIFNLSWIALQNKVFENGINAFMQMSDEYANTNFVIQDLGD